MKRFLSIIGIAIFSLSLSAQNDVDVLRYSQYQLGGTARSIGFGGAMGSLGADFSALSINPAGIGLYKKSEVSITPTFYFSNINASMNASSSSGYKDNFNLNSYGIVLASDLGNDKGWKYIQFGIGVNRTNNFNYNYHITNENTENSLLSDYQVQAFGKDPSQLDPFSTDLAWYNYLLEDTVRTGSGALAYTSPLAKGGAHQELKNTTWGSTNEMDISFGSSFSDIVYIGGTIGIPFVRYFEQYEYSESDLADTIANFNKFILDQSLETHGSGINFKFGIILRPTGFMRIGIAYHSPSYLYLDDKYSSRIVRLYDDGTTTNKESSIGRYNYQINTPMKIVGSATFTIARFFLISADVDYINYSSGKLKADDYAFYDENAEIRDKYQPALNLRAGAELRLRPMSFRVGLGHYGSPYKDNINSGDSWVLSAGLGYRDRDFYMDLGVSNTTKAEDYYLYNPQIIEKTELAYSNYRVAISVGYKF